MTIKLTKSVDAAIARGLRLITGRSHYALHVHISVVFVFLILISGTLIGWHNYRQSSALILSASDDLFERIDRETKSEVNRVYAPIEAIVDLVTYQRVIFAQNLTQRLESLPYLHEALRQSDAISGLYVGYDNGDFFMVRPLSQNPKLKQRLAAPDGTHLMVQSVERDKAGRAQGTFLYFDRDLKLLTRHAEPSYSFDPRTRNWYQLASQSPRQIRTPPYVYFTTREAGATFARRAQNGRSVVGADLTLTELSDALARQHVSPSAQLVLFDTDGKALAYPDPARLLRPDATPETFRLATVTDLGEPALDAVMQRFRAGEVNNSFTLEAANREWKGRISRLDIKGSQKVYLAVLAPTDELLTDAARVRTQGLLITLGILLLTIPIAWLLSRSISKPLRQLSADAAAIQKFQFDKTAEVSSFVVEIDDLARAMDTMRATIQKFLEISSALGADKDLDHLLERVVAESLALARADVAVIYLMEDDGVTLTPMHQTWRDASHPPSSEKSAALNMRQHGTNLVAAVAREGQARVTTLHGSTDEPTRSYFAGAFTGLAAERLGVAAIPLHNRQREVVGVLVFGRKLDAAAKGEPFQAEFISFIEALSGTAAVSIEARRLLKMQKDLLDAFIQLIAGAIDAKSPYTGGHCQRVPELTFMLARAACDAEDGPYRDFTLSDQEWEAVHIAGWLHDCGKVTTPEYVVDKATKLETIYDRIHEIRMRFEVLKRDAEIEFWKAGGAEAQRPALQAKHAELDDEFKFIAESNLGGEFMAPEKIERVKKIARRTWTRTLDDRLGVSWEERARMDREPAKPLPATEPLLADKPEHVFTRGAQDDMPADNPWGFKLNVPKAKFNKGEIYNLSVGRGTLTEEERFKINDHMVQTIIMLKRLPFPKHLRQVPEIAGGHHEKMDGTGYPKRLKRDDMSPVARMMAIADIFEALTAADRPYKKGKTLSEAIKIMGFMKKDQHIDPEAFELFLVSGVYRQYAERFLKPEQIDDVDIHPYLQKQA